VSARVVVLGIVGRSPLAGVAWQALHYLEGFRRLGHDVYYVEDTGLWSYDPQANTFTDDGRYASAYLRRLLGRHGFDGRWVFRAARPGCPLQGLSAERLTELYASADAIINVTGSTELREEHLQVQLRAYVETDPVLRQVEIAQGREHTIDLLAAHTHHFSYGENYGAPDCGVPIERFHYLPTRQPVVLEWWPPTPAPPDGLRLTTIGNWQQFGRDIELDGEVYYWSKHHEFLKVLELPYRAGARFELALSNCDPEAQLLLQHHGWRLADALALSVSTRSYRRYIRASDGEFTVAKDQNVRLRSGWFSDRSACYLAAGKPVVTQDTGFGEVLPTGEGLHAFDTVEDAVAAFESVESDYERHSRAAVEIAREYFAAERVLAKLLSDLGL
jgi:hypothetical protein